jgi:hypothetical protein
VARVAAARAVARASAVAASAVEVSAVVVALVEVVAAAALPEVAAVLLAAVGGMVRHRRRSPTAWRTPPHVAEGTISPKGLPPMLPPWMPGGKRCSGGSADPPASLPSG